MNRRTLASVVLLLGLLAPWTLGFAPPRQEPTSPLTLQVDAGYGLRFRGDTWTPLRLTLSNDGPDVRGSLRVRAENNAGLSGTTYSTPIDLPRQSRKQVFLYAAIESFARQMVVELVDETGAVLTTQTGQLLPAEAGDILTAVVTDAPGGSVDLSGIALGEGQSYQANWSVENIPPLADALLGLDVILFSDVDTGRMSVEQQAALADWVLAGGHLIVCGGPNYRLTTAALAGLLPLDISGTTTAGDLSALAAYAGRAADSLVEPDVILATGTLRPGAQVLVAVEAADARDVPLLVRRDYGEGRVDFLAADPGLAPFRRWRGNGALWETVVILPEQTPSWSYGVQDWTTARTVVQESPGFDLPTPLEMFGLLLGYIAVIGPLNYAVLHVLRRRELAWITIPALVVLFSVLAYVTGFSLRGTRATFNRLVLIQVWPDGDRAQVDGLVGLLSPRRGVYSIAAPEGFTLRPLPEETTVGGGLGAVQLATQVEQTDRFGAADLRVDASFVAGFAVSGFIDTPPRLESDVTLTLAADGSARIGGTVSNTTGMRLEDAVVLVRGGFQHVGSLEPGQRAGFDLPLTNRQSMPLSLVSSREGDFTFGRLDLTAQDVLGAGYNPAWYYAQNPDSRTRLLRQRQDFLRALAPDLDFSGGRGDRVYLVGWNGDNMPLDMALEGAAWIADDTSLYIFELPVSMARPEGEVTIGPGFSTWAALPETTVPLARPYNLSLNGGERAGFRFVPLAGARLAEVTRLEITVRQSSYSTASVFVWDWAGSEWILLDIRGGSRATLDDPGRFLGPGQAVQVLIVPDNVTDLIDVGEVDVTWTGTF